METGSMKSPIRSSAVAAAVLAVALGTTTHAASATTPTTPASGTPAPARTYPSLLPLTLQVSADETHELKTLRDFTITAQGEEDYTPTVVIGPVDPFTSENTCARPMPQGISGCVINSDGTVATLRINWQVPRAGSYRFVLSGKRGTVDRVVTIGAFDLDALD
jgi:hypothetical protein